MTQKIERSTKCPLCHGKGKIVFPESNPNFKTTLDLKPLSMELRDRGATLRDIADVLFNAKLIKNNHPQTISNILKNKGVTA